MSSMCAHPRPFRLEPAINRPVTFHLFTPVSTVELTLVAANITAEQTVVTSSQACSPQHSSSLALFVCTPSVITTLHQYKPLSASSQLLATTVASCEQSLQLLLCLVSCLTPSGAQLCAHLPFILTWSQTFVASSTEIKDT